MWLFLLWITLRRLLDLAVAEAMAAGVPLVVSDWNGYRDLVRDGIDGFRVPTRWASVAEQASVQLGWQQLLGLEPTPKWQELWLSLFKSIPKLQRRRVSPC